MTDPTGAAENVGRIRVLIVDDHAVVRSGLSAFLSVYDDLELVGGGLGEPRPCAGVLNCVRCGADGPGHAGDGWGYGHSGDPEACPYVQVIALTSFKEDDLVKGALQAGAIAYLLKNVSGDEPRIRHSGGNLRGPADSGPRGPPRRS